MSDNKHYVNTSHNGDMERRLNAVSRALNSTGYPPGRVLRMGAQRSRLERSTLVSFFLVTDRPIDAGLSIFCSFFCGGNGTLNSSAMEQSSLRS